jgi:SAM-dependent methyltransferase
MSFVSVATERLTYFDVLLDRPDWAKARVLDFGGNKGASLSSGRIKESNYWCLDVSRDAIEYGKREHPQAHWIFYDRYNFHFNPLGVPGLPIPMHGERFDYILAYSVFTHTSRAEMIELVASLRSFLTENGRLAFTFIDPHYELPEQYSDLLRGKPSRTNLRLRLEKLRLQNPAVPVEGILAQASASDWCTIVNDSDVYVNHEQIGNYPLGTKKLYDSFFTPKHMKQIYPEASILPPPHNYHAAGAEMQHCCILGPPKH